MGLTGRLARFAAARPRPLVVSAPGGTPTRLAVERLVRCRGWSAAQSAAHSDLLVVCGPVGPELAPVVEQLWQQLPAPRSRCRVDTARDSDVDGALAEARRRLEDLPAQRLDAAARLHQARERAAEPGGESSGHSGHGGSGGHGGMGPPAGLGMAERGPDRDGLQLDRLHLQLGPALPYWPAGLVLHLTVQGDVVQEAHAAVLDAAGRSGESFWSQPWHRAARGEPVPRAEAARRRAAARADSLARLLGVAGWESTALDAARLRDEVLTGVAGSPLRRRCDRLRRRVRRSRLLRWSTDGLGVLDEDAGLPAGGDVTRRWEQWLEEMCAALAEVDTDGWLDLDAARRGDPLARPAPSAATVVDALPALVTGAELAAVRLVVASLDPDIDQLAAAQAPAHARA